MVANPRWTGRRGNLREIEVSFRTHGKGVPDLWRTGNLDVLASPFVPEDGDDACTEFAPSLGTTMIGFRSDRPPFDDIRMRRAAAAALRPVAESLRALGLVSRPAAAGGLLPPAMPGHDHDVSPALDPDGVRALLAEAGHEGGAGVPPLMMVISSGFELLHDPIAAALGGIGLGVEFVVHPRAARVADTPSNLWLSAWLADYPDPDGFFRGLLTDPSDPIAGLDETRRLVELLDRARASRDQDERLRIYGEVDRLLVAEWVTVIPLAYSRTALLHRPWVHGLWANALTSLRLDGVTVDRGQASRADAAG